MIKTFITALFLLFALNSNAQTQTLKDKAQTQELSKKVTALFQEKKVSECFKQLSIYWPMPQNEIDGLQENTIKYLNIISERFGKAIGTLKIKDETISDIAIRETYFVRYERHAVRLIFTYYKNDNGWILNSFSWDDSFATEFK